MELRIDPEFRDLLPKQSEEEHEALRESLKQRGCLDPIKIWGDTIVDGHNRYEICTEEGIPYKTQALDFDSRDDVIIFICDTQFTRRNISAGERIYLSEKRNMALKRMLKSQAASGGWTKRKEDVNGNLHEKISINTNSTNRENKFDNIVARDAGVGESTVYRFRSVERDSPELVPAMRNGDIEITTAYTVSKMEPDQRKEVLSKIKSGLPAQEAVRAVRAKNEPKEEDTADKEPQEHSKQSSNVMQSIGRVYSKMLEDKGEWTIEVLVREIAQNTTNYNSVILRMLETYRWLYDGNENNVSLLCGTIDKAIDMLNSAKERIHQ